VPRTFYRILKGRQPTIYDFLSHYAKGWEPRRRDPETLRKWRGISVYTTEEQARATGRRFPRIGRYIARLQIPDDVPLIVEEPDETGHCDLYAEPGDLLAWVTGQPTPVEGVP
jgi:hypothetical protein